MTSQSELVNLEDLVCAAHPYRVYKELLDFEPLMQQLADLNSVHGPKGFCIDRLFLCLLLQFMEN
ncbi:MAG: hypothetical protein PUP46_06455, partial [Endozoicomonas sp. (ex Botrylloides leachii)]|nr:hypothetical protein [Endozoicomonas sp. (ex Botrylloides leachii)]